MNEAAIAVDRLSTVLRSFQTLYTLPAEKIDAFMGAYDIFDHDWANEDELRRSMGADYYNEIQKKLVDYYGVLNHLCSVGQIEKMYIPPAMDLSKDVLANQTLFEHKMSRDLGLKPGDNTLDIGCGRGRVAANIAAYSGANIAGLNIDPDQIANATRYARRRRLDRQCRFQQGDLNQLPLPFAAGNFDAVYQIQAFSYAKNLQDLFRDIHRVLKKGAKLACLDWVSLPAYDARNARHAALMKRIKPLIGAIGTPTVAEFVRPMEAAGFEILTSENASIDDLQAPLMEHTDKFFTRVSTMIRVLVKCKVLPRHFKLLFDRLTKDGQALVEADRLRLCTTSYYVLARKPA